MQMRIDNNGKKERRKIIQRGPILVRSVKHGQATVGIWEKEAVRHDSIWKNDRAA